MKRLDSENIVDMPIRAGEVEFGKIFACVDGMTCMESQGCKGNHMVEAYVCLRAWFTTKRIQFWYIGRRIIMIAT